MTGQPAGVAERSGTDPGLRLLAAAAVGAAVAVAIGVYDVDSSTIAEIVANGQGGMPSFSDSLDEQQIQAIADFVADPSGS